MSDQIWNYYVGLVNEISRFDKPAKPIAQQRDEMIGRLATDMEQALQLLASAWAILSNISAGRDVANFDPFLVEILEFMERIKWAES